MSKLQRLFKSPAVNRYCSQIVFIALAWKFEDELILKIGGKVCNVDYFPKFYNKRPMSIYELGYQIELMHGS